MFHRKTRNPAYTDDDPRIVLALRAATESQPRQWNFFLTGCIFECVFLALTVLTEAGFDAVTRQPPNPAKPKPNRPLYVPLIRPRRPNPPPPVNPPVASRHIPKPPPENPALPPVKVKIDLSAIKISVVDDTANQITEVVRQQHGRLALLELDDPKYAHYTFNPPDWRMEERIEDVSRAIRFSMTPPSQWPLLQSLATSNGIQMEQYQVSALFDGAFYDCLELEIRSHTSPGAGPVSAVVLAFNSSRSCGIDVLNIEFAPAR